MTTTSPMRGVPLLLQDAQTTGNGLVIAIPPSYDYHSIIIQGSSGVASGAVQLESAAAPDYAGTWAPVGGGPITVVADTEAAIDFEGTFIFLRARISTDIVGGTVTVTYKGV